jgi:hypothetical protein
VVALAMISTFVALALVGRHVPRRATGDQGIGEYGK